MECLRCGAWAPSDAETGYDADAVCPGCAEDGWELTTDGQLLGPDDEAPIPLSEISELSEVSEPARAATIAAVPRRMVRARLRSRRSRGVSTG